MLSVTKAELKHIAEMVEIEKECFDLPWTYEMFYEDMIKNKNAIYLIAEFEKKVIGYLGMWKILNEGHILNLAIGKEYRKMGIASKMLDVLEETCKIENINCLTLEVNVNNIEGINLYIKKGFIKRGLRKGYYKQTNEDALIMWKESLI